MENERTLVELLNSSQRKFKYFLMGADGVLIGFIVKFTENIKTITTDMILLALSLLLLFLSFLAAVRSIDWFHAFLHKNLSKFDPQYPTQIHGHIDKCMEEDNNKISVYSKIQLYFFYFGVVFFILWRIFNII